MFMAVRTTSLRGSNASYQIHVRVIELDDAENAYAAERAFENAVRNAKAAEQRELAQYFGTEQQGVQA
jgi:hypothetical protein